MTRPRAWMALGIVNCLLVMSCGGGGPELTEIELSALRSLSLGSLSAPSPQPSNRVSDDERAARLGQRLFFDPALSANGSVACSTCHQSERYFTDGLPRSVGLGKSQRNAPTVVGAVFSPWQFWDGRRDSLWAQALSPLEAREEMGLTRVEVLQRIAERSAYREAYEEIFGSLPRLDDLTAAGPFGDDEARSAWARLSANRRETIDRGFANIGKALGAYQRRLVPAPGRFDRAMEALARGRGPQARELLDPDEWAGARLFVDGTRTLCLRCHNGPLLTNQSFHRTGTAGAGPLPDLGRFLGVQSVLVDPFNCLGPFSDADPDDCQELRFLARRHVESQSGAFKTPTLRGLSRTAPYMHDGSFQTLEAVIEHYRNPPAGPPGAHELTPLDLSDLDAAQLVAFLGALGEGIEEADTWARPPDPP